MGSKKGISSKKPGTFKRRTGIDEEDLAINFKRKSTIKIAAQK
jgi:hypothetical protein